VLSVTGGSTTVSGAVTLNGGLSDITVNGGGSLTLNGTSVTDNLTIFNGSLLAAATSASRTRSPGTAAAWARGRTQLERSGSHRRNKRRHDACQAAHQQWHDDVRPATPSDILTVSANTNITNNTPSTTAPEPARLRHAIRFVHEQRLVHGTPTGTVNFGPIFANAANTTFPTGTMLFTNGYSQTGPMTYMNGGSIGSPAGGIQINGGSMEPSTRSSAIWS